MKLFYGIKSGESGENIQHNKSVEKSHLYAADNLEKHTKNVYINLYAICYFTR